MDGVHDLGGRQGFGPVETGPAAYEPFHAAWEGRAYGLAMGAKGGAGWTIDWFRHVRELIGPVDYLTRPYFDQWVQTTLAMLIDDGALTLAEVASGRAEGGAAAARPATPADAAAAVATATDFSRPAEAPPVFAAGDAALVRDLGAAGHHRAPGYCRGKVGEVHAHHGAHLLADAGARGEERAEHLYTLAFDAAQLWPEAAGRRERVFVDLWESYLERP